MRLVLISCLLLSGCSSTHQSLVTPAPTKYRAAIVADVREHFKDPYSILDPTISEPFRGNDMGFSGTDDWVVCIRANSKNSYGGYSGQKYTAYGFVGETVVSNHEEGGPNRVYGMCSKLSYSPFKELLHKPS